MREKPPLPISTSTPTPPAPTDHVAITIKRLDQRASFDKEDSFVRNSSFLSRDADAQKQAKVTSPPMKNELPRKEDPPKNEVKPIKTEILPPKKEVLLPKKSNNSALPIKSVSPPKVSPPPIMTASPPKNVTPIVSPPPIKTASQPKVSPPLTKTASPPKVSPPPIKTASPPKNVTPILSPPLSAAKLERTDSKVHEKIKPVAKEPPAKPERRIVADPVEDKPSAEVELSKACKDRDKAGENDGSLAAKTDDALKGVGDKIKKFEKAAEDAGRVSRPGSVRGRARDARDDFLPPATPFRDNIHFDLVPDNTPTERHHTIKRNSVKWQRSESNSESEKTVVKPEPQKIIKPEFKPIASPADVTIRSPSLGGKMPEHFPSQGTAFRNVAPPVDDPGKTKNKEKYSVSKGSSYFTRGSEEIWLVKKKDIEAIEERVLESLRQGGREGGAATLGRPRRVYLRSESLEPAPRAHTLQRQTSAACSCQRKPPRARSVAAAATPRSRSRSAADDHVLDKYETLV